MVQKIYEKIYNGDGTNGILEANSSNYRSPDRLIRFEIE